MSDATASASSDNDDGDNGDANVSITQHDGRTIITKSDGSGATKTVTVTGSDPSWVGSESYHRHHGGFHMEWPWWMWLIVLGMIASIVKTAIRARAGDTRTSREIRAEIAARKTGAPIGPSREAELLAQENEALKSQIVRMEERVRVLERIVTDPAKRVSDEIDSLR